MSMRLSTVCLREPMIKFTYALAKSGRSASSSVKASSAAFAQQMGARGAGEGQIIYDSFDQLPANLRPATMTELEMETVLMGGLQPYVPKHLQKKKK